MIKTIYPYHGHDDGVVVTQPKAGKFESRPMTPAELAARAPALQIAKDIYRHANQAGVCYIELHSIIAAAIDQQLAAAKNGLVIDGENWQLMCFGPDRTAPPCQECGAMTPKDAETKCHCSGDKDYCHGCDLWPD